MNLYTYGWNNPLRYTDPTGHNPLGDWFSGYLGQYKQKAVEILTDFRDHPFKYFGYYYGEVASLAGPDIFVEGAVGGLSASAVKGLTKAVENTSEAKTVLSKGERLQIYNQRLADAQAANSADEALALMTRTKYEGRMYAPRSDYTVRLNDGGLEAITSGNIIEISPNGAINAYKRNADKSRGDLIFTKEGGGN